jgi:small-conductance mechanosensitive channel
MAPYFNIHGMNHFFKSFRLSWHNLLAHTPAILGGIICFIITLLLANFFSKATSKYAYKRSKDSLIANFIGKIAWSVVFILGTVLVLGILGLGTVSDKILAGAGITTFIVGFALKDIGENFLSGLLLAFSRPYRVGNLIECSGVKGIVKDMTMRQTTVEAENGKLILIPNSVILKNPLTKYINDDNNLRQEFTLNLERANARVAVKLITETINSFDSVMKEKEKHVKVIVDSLTGDKIKLLVIYWLDIEKFRGSRSDTKSVIMFAVFERLEREGYNYSG